MRESVGNAYLFYFVIIFVSIFVAFLAGSLSYSKAFRVKNNIINIIEEDGAWIDGNNKLDNSGTINKIALILKNIGYSVTPQNFSKCQERAGEKLVHDRTDDFLYCVYEIKENRGIRYRVVTYIYFEVPVINDVFRIPVQGETKTLIDLD